MIGLPLLVMVLIAAEEKPVPKVPVGKETTFVTGPLTAQGYIDYEAALNARMGKGITSATNANVLIWKALGPRPEGGQGMPPAFFKYLGIAEPPLDGDYLVDEYAYLKKQGVMPEEITRLQTEDFDQARQRPWTAKEFPQVAGWLAANEKPLALLVEASKRPEYFNPLVSRHDEKRPPMLIGVLLPGVQKVRQVAAALSTRAMLRVSEGKTEAAWQDLLACHRLGRLLSRGATLIEYLVGIAIDSIASRGEVTFLDRVGGTAQQVAGWRKDLQGLPPMSPLPDKFEVGERFLYLDTLQMLRRGGPNALDTLEGGKPFQFNPAQEEALGKADWEPAFRDGNRWYDRMRDAARMMSRPEREVAFAQITRDLREIRPMKPTRTTLFLSIFGGQRVEKMLGKQLGDVLLTLLLPASYKVQEAADRAEQTRRNLHVAFALAEYQRAKGNYPDKLDALVPKYLAEVPPDLFSGQALIYRREGKGFLLYSVGVNGQDDGGHWHDEEHGGDDPAVRIPLPVKK